MKVLSKSINQFTTMFAKAIIAEDPSYSEREGGSINRSENAKRQ